MDTITLPNASPDPTRTDAPARRHPLRRVRDRWPTAAALALSVPGLFEGGSSTDLAGSLGGALLMLPLAYLIVAKVRRRWVTWPVVVVVVALVGISRAAGIPPVAVLGALALVVLAWSAVDHQWTRDAVFRTQAVGLAGFGVLTVAGLVLLVVDPAAGTLVVAAGWFLHGVWDFVHLRRDAVVSRSFAEWCGVVDVVLALQLVVML